MALSVSGSFTSLCWCVMVPSSAQDPHIDCWITTPRDPGKRKSYKCYENILKDSQNWNVFEIMNKNNMEWNVLSPTLTSQEEERTAFVLMHGTCGAFCGSDPLPCQLKSSPCNHTGNTLLVLDFLHRRGGCWCRVRAFECEGFIISLACSLPARWATHLPPADQACHHGRPWS